MQYPQYLRHGQETIELSGADRERVALSAMYLIGRDYAAGEARWNADRLAHEFDIPGIALAPVLRSLERGGLIVATEKEHFVPGRSAEHILLTDILDAVRTVQTGRLTLEIQQTAHALQLMSELRGAVQKQLDGRSLKDLIDGKT